MNCPHCQKKLPENYGAAWCPFCGKNLISKITTPAGEVIRPKFNWLFFALVLSAPAICVLILLTFISGGLEILGSLVVISFGGSAISGVVCGTYMALWRGNKGGRLVAEVILNSIGMAIVSFGICFVGCVAAAAIQNIVTSRK